jgi:CDP-diacylglycerol--serine O-phosphatidyltransferase
MNDEHKTSSYKRGMYLLPSLFTTGSLFASFYGVIAAIKGSFELAAVMIFVCAVLDTLDGRVARLTSTQTPFGADYDSLVDVIAFGMVPGIIVYLWSLNGLMQIGWLACFLYVACTALRLARFNNSEVSAKFYFKGLPCPAAAVMIGSTIWLWNDQTTTLTGIILTALIVVYVALMMVSNVPFRSFKDYDFKEAKGYSVIVSIVMVFAVIAIKPSFLLFTLALTYCLSGPVLFFMKNKKDANERI